MFEWNKIEVVLIFTSHVIRAIGLKFDQKLLEKRIFLPVKYSFKT